MFCFCLRECVVEYDLLYKFKKKDKKVKCILINDIL